MKNVFITGGRGGIGQGVCHELQNRKVNFLAPTRSELDLSDPLNIDSIDLSVIDTVIYCAGTNQGTYRGFEHNSAFNQLAQINVNFVSALFLAKKFLQAPAAKRFLWIGSASTLEHKPFRVCYSSSKTALKYALDSLRPAYPHIIWTEVFIGRTRTNLLWKNYEGTKSREEVEKEYDKMNCLNVSQVVNAIFHGIDNDLDRVELLP